jgi:hypothetical protein
MENFLDIFTTLVELMYRYYKRGVVKGGRLISKFCSLIPLATAGGDTEDEPLDGYLYSIADNLSGDVALLRETCGETNYLAEVRAALLIVQRIRFELDDSKTPIRAREVLPTTAKAVDEAISECELAEPGSKDIRLALEGYRMFSEADIAQLIAELPG